YHDPSFAKASINVASASDGAEPNMPAKVGGLKIAPTTANSDTIVPPRRNLSAVSPVTSLPSLKAHCHSPNRRGRYFAAASPTPFRAGVAGPRGLPAFHPLIISPPLG